jgi:hypothetical protein
VLYIIRKSVINFQGLEKARRGAGKFSEVNNYIFHLESKTK